MCQSVLEDGHIAISGFLANFAKQLLASSRIVGSPNGKVQGIPPFVHIVSDKP
jgi:hypothetical protein